MLKKIVSAAAALTIALAMAGCACTPVTPAATPTPAATAAPTAEIVTPMPEDPTGANASPDAGGQTSPSLSPDAGAGANGTSANGAGNTIADFREGAEVQAADVPQVEQAVKAKYPDASIGRITHAMNGAAQAYAVELIEKSTTRTVYVSPDGTVTDANN